MSKFTVTVEVEVEIEVLNEDVIDRCFTDGWQAHYWPVDEREEVAKHLAFNAVMNGIEDIARLDGWADLPSDAATISVDRRTFYASAVES